MQTSTSRTDGPETTDTVTSASRQHYIETGRYLTFAESHEANPHYCTFEGTGTARVCTVCGVPPLHLRPESCHVCGDRQHPDNFDPETGTGHNYWPNVAAEAAAREFDRLTVLATTPEAAYVAEHRPY